MQVSSLPAIVQDVIAYSALQRRKILFDSFGEGLQEFRLLDAIHAFPEILKPLFVASATPSVQDVRQWIRFERQGDRKRLSDYLFRFIGNLSELGWFMHLPKVRC